MPQYPTYWSLIPIFWHLTTLFCRKRHRESLIFNDVQLSHLELTRPQGIPRIVPRSRRSVDQIHNLFLSHTSAFDGHIEVAIINFIPWTVEQELERGFYLLICCPCFHVFRTFYMSSDQMKIQHQKHQWQNKLPQMKDLYLIINEAL